jgi:hypothetical protein
MVATLAKIGIVPAQDFDASKLDPAVAKVSPGHLSPRRSRLRRSLCSQFAVSGRPATNTEGRFSYLGGDRLQVACRGQFRGQIVVFQGSPGAISVRACL